MMPFLLFSGAGFLLASIASFLIAGRAGLQAKAYRRQRCYINARICEERERFHNSWGILFLFLAAAAVIAGGF